MKLAIIGSRDFNDYVLLKSTCVKYLNKDLIIVSGGAKGADSLAEQLANEFQLPTCIFYPDWKTYGRAAGLIRNKLIVQESDLVIAFWNGISKGTAHGIQCAKSLHKPIEVILINNQKPLEEFYA